MNELINGMIGNLEYMLFQNRVGDMNSIIWKTIKKLERVRDIPMDMETKLEMLNEILAEQTTQIKEERSKYETQQNQTEEQEW